MPTVIYTPELPERGNAPGVLADPTPAADITWAQRLGVWLSGVFMPSGPTFTASDSLAGTSTGSTDKPTDKPKTGIGNGTLVLIGVAAFGVFLMIGGKK
jgi:hypothetical protein